MNVFNLDGRDFITQVVRSNLLERWKSGQQDGRFHVVMNLPGLAIEFLDSFVGLLSTTSDADIMESDLPLVHCYCFSRSDDPISDAGQRTASVLGLLNFEDLTDGSIRIVRNVAPGKEMLCVSFRVPLSVLTGQKSTASGL